MTAPGLISPTSQTTIRYRQWARHLTEAYDRGAESAKRMPHACISYEDLLVKPLFEVRESLGIQPLPGDWDTSSWCTKDPYAGVDPAERANTAETVALVDEMVKQGLDWQEYMRADSRLRDRVHAMMRM